MLIHPANILKRTFSREKYLREITEKYDHYSRMLNVADEPFLDLQVFGEFGIRTLGELLAYFAKYTEYGGHISMEGEEGLTLIPFHHDSMNRWLKFDNPRVVDFYDRVYERRKNEFHSRHHFDMERFRIEEEFQLNNWVMPPLDRRRLTAPISGCWDKPEVIAHFLTMKGFEVRRLSCNDGNVLRGHCFCVYHDGEFWRTATSNKYGYKNRDYQQFCKRLLSVLRRIPIFSDPGNCRIMEFGEPAQGCTGGEYVDNISRGQIICTVR